MKYLLDTNICIFFFRGKYNVPEKMKMIGLKNLCISEVTVFELYFGAEKSDNPTKNFKIVDDFIQNIDILPIYSASKVYAKIKNSLIKSGKPLHDEFDLLIGSTAITEALTLVTDNIKHFQNFENLKLENWIER